MRSSGQVYFAQESDCRRRVRPQVGYDCSRAYIRFPAAFLTGLCFLESYSVIYDLSVRENSVCFVIYLICCFRTFGNSSNETRGSTNVGYMMKFMPSYKDTFSCSPGCVSFLRCSLY